MNNKKFLSDVELIRKTFQSRKLVIFVGAGVSMNSGLPSWTNLINQLKDDIGIDSNDTEDALQAAQIYYNEKNHKEYIEKIRSILHHKKNKYNEINEAIFDLKPEHILTTNYDDLLEQVIKKQALPFSIIKKDSEFPYAANTNLLVKIHGDLDNDDFVLKEDDYLNYDTIHPLFDSFIKSMFSTKTVLFIGYSYSDINLKIILQKVRNILGKNYQNSYLLTHDEYSDHKINYLKDKGVNVVSYKKNEQFINDYINGNNASLSFYKKNTGKLRNEGQQLLDLLTFITNYDRFKENLSNLNFIEQMYLSLNRFAEMKTLPYYFIANLYPFNNTSSDIYYDDHNSYSITISNTNLIDYLDENTFYKDGNTKFKESYLTLFHNENEQTKIKEQFKA